MSNILDKIIRRKHEELAILLSGTPRRELRSLAEAAPDPPSFVGALESGNAPRLIAEVKKASPSKGIIREDFDPVWIAERYEAGGAAALSVLTDRDFFEGDLAYIAEVRAKVKLPVLRKDFIIDEAQIDEARAGGASAVLLIAACLEPKRIKDLFDYADGIGLDVLFEVHDEHDLELLAKSEASPRLVGINNRDLRTFTTDLAVTERLIPQLPDGCMAISESGLFTPEDVARVVDAGARGILVGESLMRQADPGEAARKLIDLGGVTR